MVDKNQLYKIIYNDGYKITSQIGKDIITGQVEFSWISIKTGKRENIHKDRFISRIEYIPSKKDVENREVEK